MTRPFILDPLFQSSRAINGVGPRIEKQLVKLGITRVVDFAFHLPAGIIDRRHRPTVAAAQKGQVATLSVVIDSHAAPARRGLPYVVHCHDDTGSMSLTFFNAREDYLLKQLPVGETRIVSGRLEFYNGYLQMPHPDYIVAPENADTLPAVEPVYPLTAGVTQRVLFKMIRAALPRVPEMPEWLDPAFARQQGFPAFHDAVHQAHHPADETGISPAHPARQRLAYDEMLANQLTIALIRSRQKKQKGRALAGDETLYRRALSSLPFKLTGAQARAVADIRADMATPDRMHRLLQGDVGSGKTAVAFLAMVHAIGSGVQTAMMAPTEILARQHAQTLIPLMEQIGLKAVVLTGRDKGKARKDILAQIADGAADVVIGTHALFQEDVVFNNLGFVVIDEQHRFGVHQRMQLSDKGAQADMLVMTATPIPRTLTLTLYGDMDVSRLDEKPAGRKKTETVLVSNERLDETVTALRRKIAQKERVYWVCPLVEESEKLDLAAAEERYRVLQQAFGDRVGLLHGRMKPAEKDTVMAKFVAGDTDVLVATTVIEVGVNVPEATVMVIEHAERFGLAQLHQLRGRIGRGSAQSTCILLFAPQCSAVARKRLTTIRDTDDGFIIAEEDLKLRGAGEMLGTKQSGLPAFRLTDPEHHRDLIPVAHDDARLVIERDPALTSPRGIALRTLLYLFDRDTAIKYLQSG